MRNKALIWLVVATLISPLGAQAQAGNWSAVQKLKIDSTIIVHSKHALICRFRYATDEALTCEAQLPGVLITRTEDVTIPRREIREIRLEGGRHNPAIGAAVGAVTLGALGKANGDNLDMIVGGVAGAGVGYIGGMFSKVFARGKLIYRQ